MLGTYYDSNKSSDTYLGIADLVFQNFFTISLTAPVDVSQQLEDVNNTMPNVGTYPNSPAAFMVLRSLTVTRRGDTRKFGGVREGISKLYSVTIPNGGGAQTFQLTAAGQGYLSLGALAFEGWSVSAATVGVNTLSLDRNDGNFITIGIGPNILSSNGGTVLSFTPMFGPYGFEALAPTSGGLRAQVGFFNSSGSSATVSLVMTGTDVEEDEIAIDVNYAPPSGTQITLLARARLTEDPITIPINLLIPAPYTDPGTLSYGTLSIHTAVFNQFYDTSETINTSILGSLLYLLPNTGGTVYGR